tara:strand:- start:817 stop:1560 length:744 start_codon:yes stop_codon:yes gene_type:complete
MLKVVGMVPARLESSRLPEKALIDIEGFPMVVHTCKRAQLADKLDDVFLVTDNIKIKEVAEPNDIKCIMTGEHISSSDRLAEACKKIDCDIVVNIQGDEPLVNPDHINKIVEPIINDSKIEMSVGITPFFKTDSYSDIKVVKDINNDMLYMSRNDIPKDYKENNNNESIYKLCSIVPIKKELLIKFSEWEETPLELLEDNHFLRFLEHGVKIRTIEVEDGKISVDTSSDLDQVIQLMKKDKTKLQYL